MTSGELERAVQRIEHAIDALKDDVTQKFDKYLLKERYDADQRGNERLLMKQMEEIQELKEESKWNRRAIALTLLGFIGTVASNYVK